MKHRLIALMSGLSLALCGAAVLGAGAAQADGGGDWGGPAGPSGTPVVAVFGTIVSVDQTAGTFVADAYLPTADQGDQSPGDEGPGDDQGQSDSQGQGSSDSQGQGSPDWQGQDGQGPGGGFSSEWMSPGMQPWGATQVTITTDASTNVEIDGQTSSASNLSQGDRFVALFSGSPGDSLQTLVANPAVAVYADTPPTDRQLYAFVGSVTAVTPGTGGAGTITVQVTNSVPSGLVAGSSNPATFTVSADTLVLGGTSVNGLFGGSLGDVHVGDIVAGGLIGSSGETLTQVESSPLQALIDFPAAATGSQTASVRQARAKVLNQALALFGYRGHASRARHRGHRGHARHHGRHHHAVRRHGARK